MSTLDAVKMSTLDAVKISTLDEDVFGKDESEDWLPKPKKKKIGRRLLAVDDDTDAEEDGEMVLEKTSTTTIKLIKLIESQPALWDRSTMEYKDRDAKDQAWLQIISKLWPNLLPAKRTRQLEIIHRLTRRWFNIRDAYVKCRKKKPDNKSKRPYIYSSLLKFLDPIYNLTPEPDVEYEELQYFIDESDVIAEQNEIDVTNEKTVHEEYLNTYLEEDTLEEGTPAKKAKNDPLDESVINILANLLEREEDDDRAFFKSIIPSVKALSSDAKMEFRIQVMKLLKTLGSGKKKKIVKMECNVDTD